MYRCNNCDEMFNDDEVVEESICWEDYYGVGGMFAHKNYGTLKVCPHCESEDIEECDDDEDELW